MLSQEELLEKKRARQREWYRNNREKVIIRTRLYAQANKAHLYAKKKERWEQRVKENPDVKFNKHLKAEYGITVKEYNEMFNSQEGKCSICKIHQKDLIKKLCVDHCHVSGKVRSLLCNDCNAGIGFLKDNINTLQEAIAYLEKHK